MQAKYFRSTLTFWKKQIIQRSSKYLINLCLKLCINRDSVLLSNVTPYTVKAVKVIQHLYSNVINVTCKAHAIRRMEEEIEKHF